MFGNECAKGNQLCDTNTVSGKATGVSFPEVTSSKLSQHGASTPSIPELSLWALAYEDVQKASPNLIKEFTHLLGIEGLEIGGDVEGLAQKALGAIDKASEVKLDGIPALIRKNYEHAVKVVVASRYFIVPVASTNPYTALAWTGVSLLLPVRRPPLYTI